MFKASQGYVMRPVSKRSYKAGVMAQQLRVLAALAEDQGSLPPPTPWLTNTCNFRGHCTPTVHRHICRQNQPHA